VRDWFCNSPLVLAAFASGFARRVAWSEISCLVVTEPVPRPVDLQCSCPSLRMYTAWAKMEECLVCRCYIGPLVQNGQRVASNLLTQSDMILFEECQTIVFV